MPDAVAPFFPFLPPLRDGKDPSFEAVAYPPFSEIVGEVPLSPMPSASKRRIPQTVFFAHNYGRLFSSRKIAQIAAVFFLSLLSLKKKVSTSIFLLDVVWGYQRFSLVSPFPPLMPISILREAIITVFFFLPCFFPALPGMRFQLPSGAVCFSFS